MLLIIGGFMATEALERIRSEVLELTEAERAELAHDLIASLDEPSPHFSPGGVGHW